MAGVDMCAREDLFRYTSGRWLIYEELVPIEAALCGM